jgi:hypothetical protein
MSDHEEVILTAYIDPAFEHAVEVSRYLQALPSHYPTNHQIRPSLSRSFVLNRGCSGEGIVLFYYSFKSNANAPIYTQQTRDTLCYTHNIV